MKKTTKKKTADKQADKEQAVPQEKNTAWVFIAGFLLVIILVFGLTILLSQNNEVTYEEYTYNGFEFRPAPSGTDTIWVTQVSIREQLYNIPFYYHPTQVKDVHIEQGLGRAIVFAQNPPERVYISLDPDSGSRPVIAAVEISRIFGERYNLLNYKVSSALSRAQEGMDVLVMSCDDAREGILVVEFRQTGTNQVVLEGTNCILVEYDTPQDSIRVADRFAYELLGIM